MFSFLTPYISMIKLGGIAIVGIAIVGFWMYFKHLESEVTVLSAQMATATQTIQTQNQDLKDLPQKFDEIRGFLSSLQKLQDNQSKNFNAFMATLDSIGTLAKTNPAEAAKEDNALIIQRMRCFALITGSPVAPMDKGNTLCPDLVGVAQ